MDMPTATPQLFWKKKTIISYVLSILVFMIHISTYGQYGHGEGLVSVINQKFNFFFTESISRFAVPMFFILSGIAFFRNFETGQYFRKLKSRLFTLLIPYLVWNTLWMLFDIVCSHTFISKFFIGRPIFDITLPNILRGIFLHKCVIPFWFILDLMIFIVLSPIINLVIKNKYVGIAAALALSVLLVFEISPPIMVSTNKDSIVYFILGGILGKHYFGHLCSKSSVPLRIASVAFLTVMVVLKNLFPDSSYTAKPFVTTLVYILCAASLWFIFDWFIDRIKERPLYTRSFMVFAIHTNVSAIITKLITIVLPRREELFIFNFTVTIILTLFLINVFCILLEKYLPSVNYILSGKKVSDVKKEGRESA